MKKFFLFCMMALVTMCGLNSCSDDCDHEFIEHDFTQDLVGTWTCLQEGLAEALVILIDAYGVEKETGYLKGALSREDLAGFANMTASNAIRTLAAFDSEGLIAIEGKKIKVLNESQLRKVCLLG
mgnify:CR=1 FL=1